MSSGVSKDFVFELLIPKISDLKLGDNEKNRVVVKA